MAHEESHRSQRSNWLRAAVLGANDGTVSTASLLLGIAAAHGSRDSQLVAGVAALVAGAMSMGAGEFVSVSSQADTERADLKIEKRGIEDDYEAEHEELAHIYIERGLKPDLAHEVARQLMAHDALNAHARDELGITDTLRARPFQAAAISAASFTLGAIVPVATVVLYSGSNEIPVLAGVSLAFLAMMGAVAARAGGANPLVGAGRVLFWGGIAMAITAAVGSLI